MGIILDCLKPKPDPYEVRPAPSEQSERTPLLAHIPPANRLPPTSARYKGSFSGAESEELTDVLDETEPDLSSIYIQNLQIPEIDKQFQHEKSTDISRSMSEGAVPAKDHATLYNEYYQRHLELQDCMRNMNADKEDGFTGVGATMVRLREGMSERALQTLQVKRRYQFCIELLYEGSLLDERTNLALQTFNRANRLIKELLDKKKAMIDSVQIVLKSEDRIKRDVFVHCTDSQYQGQGPEFWRTCLVNLKLLRRIPPAANYIANTANQAFEQLVHGASVLSKE